VRKKAFTLIELLVVVAIIALLISILLPSLQRAKKQARQLQCLTNLRSQGQAARFYAADNKDYIPRAIQGFEHRPPNEYHIYATCLLKYLGWTGSIGLSIGRDETFDVVVSQDRLWGFGTALPRNKAGRILNALFRTIPQYQCPDFPDEAAEASNQPGTSPMDYVASAMPVPYTMMNVAYDNGNLEWSPEDHFEGVGIGAATYMGSSRLDKFPSGSNAAALIYVTEAHTSLPWKGGGPRYHHFFLGQQLPFGGFPRIANDQRHPGGINALFFGGNARTLDLHQMDPAWPKPLDQRLRWFTVMPDDYQP